MPLDLDLFVKSNLTNSMLGSSKFRISLIFEFVELQIIEVPLQGIQITNIVEAH